MVGLKVRFAELISDAWGLIIGFAVPIECYVMQGEYPLPARVVEKFAKTGGELCKNVFMMSVFNCLIFTTHRDSNLTLRVGKSGIITTVNGLRIACLGGTFNPEIYGSAEAAPGFMSPFFSYHTIDRLLSNTLAKTSTTSTSSSSKQQKSYSSLAAIQATASSSQLIDILLTNVWPVSITEFSNAPLPDPQLAHLGTPPLSDVIRKTKPRYHFAACGGQPPKFWEREPFVWDDEQGRISRFVSLGAFGGEPTAGKKQRVSRADSYSSISLLMP